MPTTSSNTTTTVRLSPAYRTRAEYAALMAAATAEFRQWEAAAAAAAARRAARRSAQRPGAT